MGTKRPLGISSILTADEHKEKKKLEEAEFKDELFEEGRDYTKDEPKESNVDNSELIDDLYLKILRLETLMFEESGTGRWDKVRVLLVELKEGLKKLE